MFNNSSIRTIGIDVHNNSHALSTYCPETDSYSGEITFSRCSKVAINYIRKLEGTRSKVVAISVFEVESTGHGLQRDLIKMGIDCKVMAPAITYEEKGGNRVRKGRVDSRRLTHLVSTLMDHGFVRSLKQ